MLDELLEGGLARASITQVYGPPASGKTTLAMSSAVSVANDGGEALYIDTEGLSLERLEQIVAAVDPDPELPDVLDRIKVSRAHDFDEQAARIREAATMADGVDLIVLDSATGLYRVEQGEETDEGQALDRLGDQLAFLLSLARRYTLSVLITNQVFTDPDEEAIRPLGGETLAHWSETILRLDRFRGGRRRVTLQEFNGEPADESIMVELTDAGLTGLDLGDGPTP